jgi:hypothetical protein
VLSDAVADLDLFNGPQLCSGVFLGEPLWFSTVRCSAIMSERDGIPLRSQRPWAGGVCSSRSDVRISSVDGASYGPSSPVSTFRKTMVSALQAKLLSYLSCACFFEACKLCKLCNALCICRKRSY